MKKSSLTKTCKVKKKNQTEILEIKNSLSQKKKKNTVESHSGRLKEVEDRISGFKSKNILKKKEEFSDKAKELQKEYARIL
jgi:hypothetical protein